MPAVALVVVGCKQAPANVEAPKEIAAAPAVTTATISDALKTDLESSADGSYVSAAVVASGDPFAAKFSGVSGGWVATTQSGEFAVPAASVDTGIAARNGHANTKYLKSGEFDTITFSLTDVVLSEPEHPSMSAVSFEGAVGIVGGKSNVSGVGTLTKTDGGYQFEGKFDFDVLGSKLELGDLFDKSVLPITVVLELKEKE